MRYQFSKASRRKKPKTFCITLFSSDWSSEFSYIIAIAAPMYKRRAMITPKKTLMSDTVLRMRDTQNEVSSNKFIHYRINFPAQQRMTQHERVLWKLTLGQDASNKLTTIMQVVEDSVNISVKLKMLLMYFFPSDLAY